MVAESGVNVFHAMIAQSSTNRREFLKRSLLGGAAALAAPWGLSRALGADNGPSAPAFTSRVALTTGEDRAELAFRGLKRFEKELSAAIGSKRGLAIRKTGAEIVITSCPFCEFHIMGHTDRPVKHVATVLLEGYREKDKKAKAG